MDVNIPLQVMNLGTGLTSGSDSELITQILCHPPDSEKKINAPDWVARFVGIYFNK